MCNMNAVGAAPTQTSMPAQVAGTTGTGAGAGIPSDLAAQLQKLAEAITAIQQALSGAGFIQQGPIQGPILPPMDPTQGGDKPTVNPTQDGGTMPVEPILGLEPPVDPTQGGGGTPPVDPAQGGTPPVVPTTPTEPAPAPTDPNEPVSETPEAAPAAEPAPFDESSLDRHRALVTKYEGKVANQQKTIADINGFLEGKRAENDQMRNRINNLEGKKGTGPEIKELRAKIQANQTQQDFKREVLKVVRSNMQQNVAYIGTLNAQMEAYRAGAGVPAAA